MSLEQLQDYRKEAAQRLFANLHIGIYDNEHYVVKSETSDQVYAVEVVHGKHYVCSCPDYEKRSKSLRCKHELAVEMFIKRGQ